MAAPNAAHAVTPVLSLSFPASWDGTGAAGTAVTDLSSLNTAKTVVAPALSSTIPAGATVGTQSLMSNGGGIITTTTGILKNTNIVGPGGFTVDTWFRWDGGVLSGTSTYPTEKIIDLTGYESLQLHNQVANTSADVQIEFNDSNTGPTLSIVPNVWYHAIAIFDTQGAAIADDGSLAGLATLTVIPESGSPMTVSQAVTKNTNADSEGRPTAVGQLAFNTSSSLVRFDGLIYNPTISLGVPEPASLSLFGLGALGLMARRRRA